MSLSGIVALFFTGICHAHYSLYSVTPQAQVTLRRFFEVAAFLCETFVFAYLGLQVRPPLLYPPFPAVSRLERPRRALAAFLQLH